MRGREKEGAMSGVKGINTRWRACVINTHTGMCYAYLKKTAQHRRFHSGEITRVEALVE